MTSGADVVWENQILPHIYYTFYFQFCDMKDYRRKKGAYLEDRKVIFSVRKAFFALC
jgi:hypothetical protein